MGVRIMVIVEGISLEFVELAKHDFFGYEGFEFFFEVPLLSSLYLESLLASFPSPFSEICEWSS